MLMSQGSRQAKLHYMANNYRMLVQGDHVLCARSGIIIPIENLRYWSVAKQEAYATPEFATQASLEAQGIFA
jgi:hypothetical protein